MVRQRSDWDFALLERCRTLIQVGRFADAVADCDRSIALGPGHAVSYESRGFAYLRNEDPAKAVEDFDRALALDPQNPTALYGRGVAKGVLGDIAGAKRDGVAARSLMPDVGGFLKRIKFLP